jgi:tetratricopeptide (TPR) repeat protein
MSVTPFRCLEFFLVPMKLECLPRYLLVFPGHLQVHELEGAAGSDFAAPKRISNWSQEGRLRRTARSFLSKRGRRLQRMAAIARDSNYVLAWAGLADSLIAVGDVEELDLTAYLPRARDAALKALQRDPSLAEERAALGMVACHYDCDWPTAEREYKKAFDLNPSYASAHQYYALGLMAHGRFAEAKGSWPRARRSLRYLQT